MSELSPEDEQSEVELLTKPLWPLRYAQRVGAYRYLIPWPAGYLRQDRQDNWAVTATVVVMVFIDLPTIWTLIPGLTEIAEKGLLILAGLLALSVAIPGTGLLRRMVADDERAALRSVFPYLWFLFFAGSAAIAGRLGPELVAPPSPWAYAAASLVVFAGFSLLGVVSYAAKMYMLSLAYLQLDESEKRVDQSKEK